MSRRRAALSTMGGATANTVVVALQALVLIPLYLAHVGPRLYGAWLGSGDLLLWMQAMDFGLPNLLIQRIGAAEGRRDRALVLEYFASGVAVLAVIAAVLGLAGVACSPFVARWMGLAGTEAATLSRCFALGAVATACVVFNNSVVGLSRGVQRTGLMNATLIVSALAGFGVSLGGVLAGWGLWAIPAGIVSRALVSLAGSALFVAGFLRGHRLRDLRPRRKLIAEMTLVSPATALGGVSYAVMNQSEAAFVAVFIRPELAPVLALTRKLADLARSLIDTIGYSVYGGFAHLVASPDRHRAPVIHAQIRSLRLSLAVAAAAAYVAVNRPLMALWVGERYYGGLLLTTLIALQFVVVGSSYLMNSLYRATGAVLRGSILQIVECCVRVPLMVLLLLSFGLPGLVSASTITAAIFGVVAYRWTLGTFERNAPWPKGDAARMSCARVGVITAGLVVSALAVPSSWPAVLSVAAFVGAGAVALQLFLDPLFSWSGLRRPSAEAV